MADPHEALSLSGDGPETAEEMQAQHRAQVRALAPAIRAQARRIVFGGPLVLLFASEEFYRDVMHLCAAAEALADA